jgi:hypothetical protein
MLFDLRAPSFIEVDLVLWCKQAENLGLITEYSIWCEEDEAAILLPAA